MDRFKQKTKKDKPLKHVDKDNPTSFITDIKSMKENLKIKEILRTVKMNSSMRVKAPRGSKIMNNKDFNDNDDLFNDVLSKESSEHVTEPPCAMNPDVIVNTIKNIDDSEIKTENCTDECNLHIESNNMNPPENSQLDVESLKTKSTEEIYVSRNRYSVVRSSGTTDIKFLVNNAHLKSRDRKLSLDHTMLTRREGLSQSELDLHSIGKSPLERKSSFFRKKMDSFLKNTSEIFKRQSQCSKPQPIQRRGSISISLQSLNEKSSDYNALLTNNQGSSTSLQSSGTMGSVGRSTSSLSAAPVDRDALVGSQPALSASQPISDVSTHSLNEAYIEESLFNTRAISMSSGLDSAHSTGRRRKSVNRSNTSNRVTWVASEGLTNYFRRIIQDEKSKEPQVYHSYSDFTTIPENDLSGPRLDWKGRRLSYQRAVSGEDPVIPTRYHDSLRRRQLIPENSEANNDLSNLLTGFTNNGVPPLQGFAIADIEEDAFTYLHWAEHMELEEFEDFATNVEEKEKYPLDLSQEQWDEIEKIKQWEQQVFIKTKLPPHEESRQAVIRELVTTEAVHIRHLFSVVEVFIAAAHALQDAGKLLDIDTERLFSNIPDVLNASLYFWEITFYPMIIDAVENGTVFNTEFMSAGFCRFREIFGPYEKFVSEQTKALDYLRSLTNNKDFMLYLSWCHSQKECKRLQLSDILVKPMQRLTKYSLILCRIISHTETEPDRTSLVAMETFAKNYVLDLNRSIRQKEELEKLDNLANSIDSYEIDFKDEDLERYFKLFSQLNLKAPMINCLPNHSRTIIHEGDVRFKDQHKEIEVRAFLLTDMLLICKKQSKGSNFPYKLIRPKYMVEKMLHFAKFHPKNPKELVSLAFVVLDEVGTSSQGFVFTETSKDPQNQSSLKLWESKLREAKLTYDLSVWFARNPSRDLSEVEMDTSSDYGFSSGNKAKLSSDDLNIYEARERVAAMVHRPMGTSTEYDISQASMATDSFDAAEASTSGTKTPGVHNLRHPMHRNSTEGSSHQSRLSSFQQSTSAASHDEPQIAGSSKNIYRAGSSVEHFIPPKNAEDTVTSITVNVVSESECETVIPVPTPHQSPSKPGGGRSVSSGNTLRVEPLGGPLALVHSLPDLTVEPSTPRSVHSPYTQTASEKLYQSHQELLQRKRLVVAQQHHQFLTPNHRGSSYPPPSPTRGSLKRGLAFSYSFKNPPLSKMGHVHSQSQLQAEAVASTSQQGKVEEITVIPTPGPSTSSDKAPEKKSKQFISRNKGNSASNRSSPSRNEDEQVE